MKKSLKYLAVLTLLGTLAACDDQNETTVPKEPNDAATKTAVLTTEEFLQKLSAEQTELKSFGIDMALTATSTVDEKEVVIPLTITMDATAEPLRIKQTMQSDLREFGLGKSDNLSYILDGLMYIKHPENGTWVKTEIPQFENYMKQSMEQSPAEQMEKLKKYAHLFTVKESEKTYELTFKGDEKAMQTLLNDQLLPVIGDNRLPITAKEEMNYQNVNYQLSLDKKSLLPLSMNIKTDVQTTVNNEPFTTKIDMAITYRDLNTLAPIELPEEAKKAKNPTEE